MYVLKRVDIGRCKLDSLVQRIRFADRMARQAVNFGAAPARYPLHIHMEWVSISSDIVPSGNFDCMALVLQGRSESTSVFTSPAARCTAQDVSYIYDLRGARWKARSQNLHDVESIFCGVYHQPHQVK